MLLQLCRTDKFWKNIEYMYTTFWIDMCSKSGQTLPELIDSYFWVYNSKGINPDSPASIFKFDGMVQ